MHLAVSGKQPEQQLQSLHLSSVLPRQLMQLPQSTSHSCASGPEQLMSLAQAAKVRLHAGCEQSWQDEAQDCLSSLSAHCRHFIQTSSQWRKSGVEQDGCVRLGPRAVRGQLSWSLRSAAGPGPACASGTATGGPPRSKGSCGLSNTAGPSLLGAPIPPSASTLNFKTVRDLRLIQSSKLLRSYDAFVGKSSYLTRTTSGADPETSTLT
mmetsp:Transcript_19925/g.46677  ORF Transcript_19925/g.46677 Transcript_19925/m.46677 type:complete len:209 (-) Transcript_19925:754-1380(-)